MDQSDVHNSSAQSLSYMMDPDADSGQHWEAEELGEILEHQLAARLECDLADKSKQVSEELEAAEKSGVKTFGDLLQFYQQQEEPDNSGEKSDPAEANQDSASSTPDEATDANE